MSRQTVSQSLVTASRAPGSSPLQSPIRLTAPHRLKNRRGCAFYEYLGSVHFKAPPVSIEDAALGVLFLQKKDVAALAYHAAWMIAEVNGVKRWIRCGPFVLHPDQKRYPGKVLSLREGVMPSPAWVPRRVAIDIAVRDCPAFRQGLSSPSLV